MEKSAFNYDKIPIGYYDLIAEKKSGIRSFWHNHKFERVLSSLPNNIDSLIDIGCFSGTFLGMIPEERCSRQTGIDIILKQIEDANQKYATTFRSFYYYTDLASELNIGNEYKCASLIEVIEHLNSDEIKILFEKIYVMLEPDGLLVMSTPNYFSMWPILEILINIFSSVKYEEQHLTRFTYFNIISRIRIIIPNFDRMFKVKFKTTSHFISPYVAFFSYSLAALLAGMTKPQHWHFPFGSIIIVCLEKKM